MNVKKDFIFRKAKEPTLISDIAAYSEDQILNSPFGECDIFIGIDSQYYNKYKAGYFAIVVAYHYGSKFNGDRIGKGIHYVYHDFIDSNIKNKEDRLRKETLYLMEFASYLIFDKGFSDFSLEFDYNVDEDAYSNKFIDFAANYAKGVGIQSIITKPYTVACKAADNVVRSSFRNKSKVQSLMRYLHGK